MISKVYLGHDSLYSDSGKLKNQVNAATLVLRLCNRFVRGAYLHRIIHLARAYIRRLLLNMQMFYRIIFGEYYSLLNYRG